MPSDQITQLTDRQRQALLHGKTVEWVAAAFHIPRSHLVARLTAEDWIIDPSTDQARERPTDAVDAEEKAVPMPVENPRGRIPGWVEERYDTRHEGGGDGTT